MATIVTRRTALRGLRCRACHLLQPADERYVCADCYGPIEPEYDTASFDTDGLRGAIEHGPRSLWRYAPLLPIAAPESHFAVGWTPLIKAPRLGAEIGVSELYVKDDSRNPSLSFKDRPVALALARALELGLDTIACASTGNLAGAVAAAAARNGLRAFVFVPAGTDESKVAGAAAYGATVVRVDGTYDQVNRLCARLADESGWGFVNFNLRPYYAEGSKTLLFECAEQLGCHLPEHVLGPVGRGARAPRADRGRARRARRGRRRRDGTRPRRPRRVRRWRPRRPLCHRQRVQGCGHRDARSGHRPGRRRVPRGVREAARVSLTVRLATPLRRAAGGNATITVEAASVSALAKAIGEQYPELGARVLRDGAFGRFVNVFVDGEDVRFLGPEGDLSGKSTIEILPATSGGAVAPLPRQRPAHERY